MNVFIQSE